MNKSEGLELPKRCVTWWLNLATFVVAAIISSDRGNLQKISKL